jgi:hypothetical protein
VPQGFDKPGSNSQQLAMAAPLRLTCKQALKNTKICTYSRLGWLQCTELARIVTLSALFPSLPPKVAFVSRAFLSKESFL